MFSISEANFWIWELNRYAVDFIYEVNLLQYKCSVEL